MLVLKFDDLLLSVVPLILIIWIATCVQSSNVDGQWKFDTIGSSFIACEMCNLTFIRNIFPLSFSIFIALKRKCQIAKSNLDRTNLTKRIRNAIKTLAKSLAIHNRNAYTPTPTPPSTPTHPHPHPHAHTSIDWSPITIAP